MIQGIVDVFEVVQVDEEQGQYFVFVFGVFYQQGYVIYEGCVVEQVGQGVVVGQVLDVCFVGDVVVDVVYDGYVQFFVVVFQCVYDEFYWDVCVIFVQDGCFVVQFVFEMYDFFDFVQFIGGDEGQYMVVDYFFQCIVYQFIVWWVDIGCDVVFVEKDVFYCGLYEFVQLCFGFVYLMFCQVVFGDVVDEYVVGDGFVVWVQLWDEVYFDLVW